MSPDDLRRLNLIDASRQADLSAVLQLASDAVEADHLFVAILDDARDRICFAGNHGRIEAARTRAASPITQSLAAVVRDISAPLVIDDAVADSRVCDHPFVTHCGYKSYLGVPITGPTGDVIGAVSAGAVEAHRWTLGEVRTMRNAGHLVSQLIMLRAMSRVLADVAIRHPMLGRGQVD
ncbi:MAG: GAF domain-containing protein [Rhodobacteraceae bacterium]|jgi:GAF domain-containing protein|nr:GAF domain-containing protein [Paracoccaceae bacterium]